jgi:hypothetical protein
LLLCSSPIEFNYRLKTSLKTQKFEARFDIAWALLPFSRGENDVRRHGGEVVAPAPGDSGSEDGEDRGSEDGEGRGSEDGEDRGSEDSEDSGSESNRESGNNGHGLLYKERQGKEEKQGDYFDQRR